MVRKAILHPDILKPDWILEVPVHPQAHAQSFQSALQLKLTTTLCNSWIHDVIRVPHWLLFWILWLYSRIPGGLIWELKARFINLQSCCVCEEARWEARFEVLWEEGEFGIQFRWDAWKLGSGCNLKLRECCLTHHIIVDLWRGNTFQGPHVMINVWCPFERTMLLWCSRLSEVTGWFVKRDQQTTCYLWASQQYKR